MIKHTLLVHAVLIILIVLFAGCGESIEDPDAPGSPIWVAKSAPTAPEAHGIRPYNEGNGILLEWHPNPEEDISGYKLYKAEDDIENKFILAADINAFSLSGADTFFIDDSVKFGVNYYYYLKAYDQAGNKSDPSDTVMYGLISKVEPLKPSGTLTSQPTAFQWYDYSGATSEYVIFLETFAPQDVVWISRFTKPNYGDFFQRISFNFDNSSKADTLVPGQKYRWCVKAITFFDPYTNIDIGGSVSIWAYFTIEQ